MFSIFKFMTQNGLFSSHKWIKFHVIPAHIAQRFHRYSNEQKTKTTNKSKPIRFLIFITFLTHSSFDVLALNGARWCWKILQKYTSMSKNKRIDGVVIFHFYWQNTIVWNCLWLYRALRHEPKVEFKLVHIRIIGNHFTKNVTEI